MNINNNIEESRCSFEVSKLLKEKGFDCKVNSRYNKGIFQMNTLGSSYKHNSGEIEKHYISAPTHALAVEWIRVNFGIYISIIGERKGNAINHFFHAIIHKFGNDVLSENEVRLSWYSSPQEATEAALLHVLTNLIK